MPHGMEWSMVQHWAGYYRRGLLQMTIISAEATKSKNGKDGPMLRIHVKL